MHLAIIDNDIDSLKSLLIDCNTPCKQRSPLSLAVELNRAAAAQCLLAAGANLFTKVEGMSAVEYVATRGGAEMMRALIDGSRAKGVNIVEIDNLCHAAASNANEEILAMLIDAGAAFELVDAHGLMPVHIAANNENDNAMKVLIDAGANCSAVSAGGSPCHCAATNRNEKVLARLLAAGVPFDAQDSQGHTPCHLAASNTNSAVIAQLIAVGCAVNRCSFSKRRSPLHFAALNANEDVIAKLIAANADLNLRDTDGTTALSEAVLNRNERVFAMLIAAGAAPRAHKLTAGRSLVHLAATNPNVLVLKQVIAMGGDPNAPDRHKRTPLHHAAERGSTQVIEALVSMGAAIDAVDEWAKTTAHVAATNSTEVLRLVIALGADIDARDKSGRSPCEMAAARGCCDNMLLLINSGAQRVSATNLLRTIAAIPDDASGKKDEAMRFLIKRGASIRGIDESGQTPLFRASPRAIAILFAHGVDINCRDNNQATPSHIATRNDGCSLMTLIAAGADLTAPPSGWIAATRSVDQLSWLSLVSAFVSSFELPPLLLENASKLFAAQQCALLRLRALEICIGLQSFELPALVTCEILSNVFAPIESMVPFHRVWEIVTKIKHCNCK